MKAYTSVTCFSRSGIIHISVDEVSKKLIKMFILYIILFGTQSTTAAQNIGWFWHVTDFHYDFSYWTNQLSCNEEVTSPGIYGDYWCDSPWLLIQDSIASLKNIRSDVDFILWTGDNVGHIKDKDLTIDINLQTMENITNELKINFPSTPVYATLGNHDYWPSDQFPPNTNTIYQRVAEMWKDWINDPEQVRNFENGAYYSVKTAHGLRILGLNTNLYYTSNKNTTNLLDPANQFEWLDTQLDSALSNYEKVIITAHIPPGMHTPNGVLWLYQHYNERFLDILDKYVDYGIIVGMYFGHDHSDGFKIHLKSNGSPGFPVFTAPSVTPWRYKIPTATGSPHNPGIKLLSYDRDTGQPLNIFMYYINLPESNSNNKTDWKLEYNFTDVYKTKDVTATSLNDVIKRMERDPELRDLYIKFKDVSVSTPKTCDEKCGYSLLCGFKLHRKDLFDKCLNNYISGSSILSPSLVTNISVLLFIKCGYLMF